MAPKQPKEYSFDLRELIIKHLNGNSDGEIVNMVLILRGSVHYITNPPNALAI